MAAVVKVGDVRLPLKAIVPVVSVRATAVPTNTLPLKVVPPEFVTVRFFMLLVTSPIAPLTVAAPVVFKVRLEELSVVVLLIEARLIGVAAPAPTVSVEASAIVASVKVICPVDVPPIVVLPVTLMGAPRLMTPVPAADTVPSTLIADGAVAMTPPVKARVTPEVLFRVSAPVFAKVVIPAIVPPWLICKL